MADGFVARPSGTPVLEIKNLNVLYGRSHALQGVDLTLRQGALSVVGRNGMGKTTLCNAIMGLVRASSGSIRFGGEELVGRATADIARLGIGYVPQGRRLWRTLTVDEHLRLVAGERRGAWTIERIYDTFPRLAERKSNAGSQLSGGEQQMVAISRALLLNPRLLVMDEPTEGLAPVIVAQVDDILVRLAEDGEIAVLVIEQNIGVATAVADTVAIMVNGRINRLINSRELAADRDLQERLLGVGRHGHEGTPEAGAALAHGAPAQAGSPPPGPTRIYVSNPKPPTRWSQPVPAAQIDAHARTVSAAVRRVAEMPQPGAAAVSTAASEPFVVVAGTLDTKGDELRLIRDILKDAGLRTRLVDLSTSGKPSGADVPPIEVGLNHPRGAAGLFTGDRGTSVAAMAQAFEAWIKRQTGVAGIISAGGSGGTAMVAPAMRALPVGVPKVLISTVASGNVQAYVGPSDIMMMYSVTDVQGLNSISRQVLANGAQAMAGMVKQRLAEARAAAQRQAPEGLPAVGLTMFGVTTTCVQQVTSPAQGRVRLPGVPRHRHRRPVHGEAGRLAAAVGRHRRHHHRNLRHDDGRRVPRHRGSLRRHHPRAAALRRLGRRARHGQLRRARDGPRALQGPRLLSAQSAGDPHAHHRGGERAHGVLDRRAAEPHGGAGALPAAGGRCLRARCAGPALP